MVRVYDELDEVKAGIEKLREECRAKTELCGSLKKAHVELAAKLQEARLEIERQTKELCVKSKEIFEVRQLYEEIKSILHEKESFLQSLSSANQKLRVDYCEKVGKLEGENKELVLALDEATTKIQELERKVCASDKEINALKETLSVIKEKGIEAQLNVQASRELKEANEVIQKLEEDNRIAQDQLKWKNEQFTYLEEVHRRLHDNFQTSKAEWGKEKSDLLEEISSLQTSLDSQIRISQDLETQLRLCNQALAHEESRRKVLEVEVSDFKSRCDDILLECQETKSKHEHLTLKRDEEIGELRNLLRTKETLFKEMKLRASQLEQDKLDLCASLIPRKSKFAAFEFTAEDERVEKDSRITLCKFKKRKSPQKHSPINKYTFLKSFDRGVKNTLNEFVDELVDTGSSNGPMDVGIIKSPTVVSSGFSGCKPSEHNRTEYHGSEFSSLATTTSSARLSGIVTDDKHVCSPPPLIPADNEPVVVDSNDDPVIELRLPKSASIAQLQGLPDEHALKYSSNEALVVVIPDHIIYRNIWSTRSCLEFSPKCIRLDALPISETRPLTYKWKVSAIVDIQSVWIDSIKTADVMVRLISRTQRSRDVRILRFAVCEPDWSDRQEAIQSLDFRYKDRWRTAGVENMGSELFLGQERFSPSSTSFPIFEESFHEVIYPKGDPDAISISKRDVDRLQPETFINDTIVDFYITYLKNNIRSEEEKHRFHFFNCFFFRKLADLDKDPSQVCEGRAAFQRVRRWTMKVDIFKKDYIFVPINFSYHWSLIVICHPGEVAGYRDNEMEKSSRVPCILHMDSLRGSHKGLKDLFQSYLWEEWKERHGELAENMRRKFFNLQFVHLKPPQQENLFDCGLFLLHYVELFLEQAPLNFSPAGITESSKFLSKDWFQPKDVSYKRDHIRKLIYEILKHTRDDCSTDSDYKHSLNSINKEHAGVEFVNELCSSRETSQINDFHSPADAEVQILSPPRTHVKSLKFAGVTDLVPGDLSPQGDTPMPATINNYMHSGQKLTSRGSITMSPIEEEEETGEEFMDFSPALKRGRTQQIEHFALCPVNEDIKPSFGMKTGGLSMSSQVCPGEEVNVESSSSSDEESVDCIVVDSPGEIDTCDDIHDTSECSFRQKTITCFHCSLEADSTEHEANRIQSYVQKEEQAAARPEHLPEIIEVSGSDTGEDKGECLVTSTAESAAYIVEDSEEDEDNVEGSMNRVQPLLRSKPRWKTEMDDECGLIAKLKMVES